MYHISTTHVSCKANYQSPVVLTGNVASIGSLYCLTLVTATAQGVVQASKGGPGSTYCISSCNGSWCCMAVMRTWWPGCVQAALHPTPAVCGRPRATAKDILASQEPFDRGFYSGPFGWLSGSAAEFVVAIRSALVQPDQAGSSDTQPANNMVSNGSDKGNGSGTQSTVGPAGEEAFHRQSRNSRSRADMAGSISLFAGVGIVKGSTAEAEWQVWLSMLLTLVGSH